MGSMPYSSLAPLLTAARAVFTCVLAAAQPSLPTPRAPVPMGRGGFSSGSDSLSGRTQAVLLSF